MDGASHSLVLAKKSKEGKPFSLGEGNQNSWVSYLQQIAIDVHNRILHK